MSMQDTRVIIFGIGSVGKEVVKALSIKKGLRIVGALDKGPVAGRDLGEVAGLGSDLGILISNDEDALFASTKADVLIHTTTTHVADTYDQLKKTFGRWDQCDHRCGRDVQPGDL